MGLQGSTTRPALMVSSGDVGSSDLSAVPAKRFFGRCMDCGGGVKTARERAEEKRLEKLELIRVQVASGALVIRPMTDEERRRYPPRHEHPKRPGSAGRGH
jgi:hypothetical protein